MSRTVFLQQKEGGQLMSSNVYTAWEGFHNFGHDCRFFMPGDVDTLPLDADSIVVGGIPIVHKAFVRMGIQVPENRDIPLSLGFFVHRAIWHTTINEVRSLQRPLFVKPWQEHKMFTGHVVSRIIDLAKTSFLPDDYPVLVSEPVNFLTEWRYYVIDREIVGLGHYKGDPLVFPDPSVVKDAVSRYASQKRSYSIDFGVLDNGATALVEVNDAYSLGNYSLPSWLYAKLIEVRWDELLGRESAPYLKYVARS